MAAIQELTTSLKESRVLTPESAEYSVSIQRWNKAIEKPAAIVVLITCEDDVATTLQFARKHELETAVRGGGHYSGDATTTNDIIIDLSHLCGVVVEPEQKVAKVQGGAKWADVAEATSPHGLAAVSGTLSQTGVGGVALGGGYGWLTGAHGLSLDNILQARVVLADGTVVNASDSENEDLFWALRGAGPSFGVVVEFTIQLHTVPESIWAGALGFPLPIADGVVAAANAALSLSTGQAALVLVITAPPPKFSPMVIASIFYNGTEDDARAFFKPLYDLHPVFDATTAMPFAKSNTLIDYLAVLGKGQAMSGSIFTPPLDPKLFRAVADISVEFNSNAPPGVTGEIIFEFHSMSKVVAVPTDSTSFANRGPHQNVMAGASWSESVHDSFCQDFVGAVSNTLRQAYDGARSEQVSKAGSASEGTGWYTNYDNGRTPAAEVFGPHYAKLAQLKARYDPDNVFKKWYSIDGTSAT